MTRRPDDYTDAEIARTQAKLAAVLGPETELDRTHAWLASGGARGASVDTRLLSEMVAVLIQYRSDMTFPAIDGGQKQRRVEMIDGVLAKIRESGRPTDTSDPLGLNDARNRTPQGLCEMWNRAFPIGTTVNYRRDDGSVTVTRTRNEASVLSGHTAVIWLEGVSGCVALDRVSYAPPHPTSDPVGLDDSEDQE